MIVRSAQFTVMVAVDELSSVSACDSFDAATTAVFERVPQSAASVAPVTCTVRVAPSARSPKLQVRTPAVIEHAAESSLQTTPLGSVSERVTPLAVPGPSLVTTIVNAAVSPALIVPWSAVLVTEMLGCTTTMALGWMLRSWFLFPEPSRLCVRMCQGAPLIVAAPLALPPLDSFQ